MTFKPMCHDNVFLLSVTVQQGGGQACIFTSRYVGDLKIIAVDNTSKARYLLNGVKAENYQLKLIVVMDTIDEDVKKLAAETKVDIMTFVDVEFLGDKNLKDFVVSGKYTIEILVHAFTLKRLYKEKSGVGKYLLQFLCSDVSLNHFLICLYWNKCTAEIPAGLPKHSFEKCIQYIKKMGLYSFGVRLPTT